MLAEIAAVQAQIYDDYKICKMLRGNKDTLFRAVYSH